MKTCAYRTHTVTFIGGRDGRRSVARGVSEHTRSEHSQTHTSTTFRERKRTLGRGTTVAICDTHLGITTATLRC